MQRTRGVMLRQFIICCQGRGLARGTDACAVRQAHTRFGVGMQTYAQPLAAWNPLSSTHDAPLLFETPQTPLLDAHNSQRWVPAHRSEPQLSALWHELTVDVQGAQLPRAK